MYEEEMFARSAAAMAEAEANLDLSFGDGAPQSLVEQFAAYQHDDAAATMPI